jgi:hypothetical protein
MSGKGRTWIILAAAAAALALAGCGAAPIPDDEIAGMAGTSTVGTGGDMTALAIFGGGAAPRSYTVSNSFSVPGVGSLTYDYTIDYLKAAVPVDPSIETGWDEVTLDGSADLVVDLPNYDTNRSLDVSFDATGFHEASGNDGRVLLNGTSTAAGSATWTNPKNDATAGYTMNLTRTWTGVNIDDPTVGGGISYPTAGTVAISGSIERHREGPSGVRTGSWSGTITITFDGDWIVPVDVNGSPYSLNLLTGEVTAGT